MAKRILMVDDEQILHRIVNRLLGKEYEMVSAFNGVEGLQKAQVDNPDLILLDVNMPEKDGRQVIQELRGNPATRKIPVIMLTANGQVMDKLAGFELGVDDYITKPFSCDELMSRIKKILAK